VVFGATVSGRTAPLPGIERMVGLFINTVPVRARLDTDLHTLLHALQQAQQEANRFAYASLAEIQRDSEVPGGTALFDSILVFENYPHDASAGADALLRIDDVHAIEQTNYLLTLVAIPGETLGFKLSFDAARIAPAAASRLLEHLGVLLAGLAETPDAELHRLPLLTATESAQLAAWNRTEADFPADLTVVDLFEAQVRASPDAVALVFEDARLSYAELNARANRLAHALIARGVGPDVLVALCVERSSAMVVGLLGILKASGAYVPLDPDYPPERLAFMLADSAAPVLVTQHRLVERLPHGDGDRLLLEEAAFAAQPADNPLRRSTPQNLAYVIYTSGSTGRPKGVPVGHGAVVAMLDAFERVAPRRERLAATAVAPFVFDVSVWETFATLCWGGTLYLLRTATLADPQALTRYLIEQSITSAYLPPALLADAVAGLEAATAAPALDRLLVGVEPILQSTLARYRTAVPGLRTVNGYGPTEATVCSSLFAFERVADPQGRVPIGRPIANTRIHILDARLQPLPIGVPGELCIAGAGLARGYLNRPELTAERFVAAELFGTTERIYRTGDLARWRPDGNLEYLGRLDHQVKLRGFRIELGEIESVLAQHLSVREAAVVLREDGDNPALAAYLTLADGAADLAALTAELRPWLKSRLPDYMVPASFTVLDAFPLTPNGKRDRRALPAPDAPQAAAGHALASETERLLAALWGDVLKTVIATREADFFALGGHSLLATRLAARIRDAFQVELPLKILFERPTLADLAAWLDGQARGDTLPPIVPQVPDDPRVPSYAQQRLWFLAQIEGASATYNMPAALTLRGTLNVDALRRTFQALVARHQSLRLVFPVVEGAPSVAELPADAPLVVVDLTDLAPAAQPAAVARRAAAHANAPFDLAAGPLLRVELLVLGADTQVLLLNLHHIIADGWSMGVLIEDWAALYRAFCAGQEPALAPLPIAYTDYAAWQRAWLTGEPLQRQLDYWSAQLADAPHLLELPADRPRPAVQSYRGAHLETRLAPDLTAALNDLGRQRGATLFMTLLAAFATLLHRYTGQDDLLIGSPIANRTASHTEGLIGLFVNTLVLRARLDRAATFAELLAQVRRTALDAYAHQDLPFEQLVERLDPARTLSHSPLFQVMFVLQNNAHAALDLPGLAVETLAQDTPIAKFDLTLNAVEDGDALALGWEYATDLFEAATVERLAGHFAALLAGIVAAPDGELSRLPLLAEAERAQLAAWNRTETAFPADLTVVDLFEAQVRASPDAVALVFEDVQLTYADLNARANRLAHALIARGVGPDVLVALCVERSIEMVVGLLGILKAGGAYVPLDPDYPPERLAFMLADSAAPLLLTQTALADALPAGGTERLLLDAPGAFADWPAVHPARRAGPDDLAYVIYTSGSTGRPKGVACCWRLLRTA